MDQETEQITLDGGAKVSIPKQFTYSTCKGCGAKDIIWAKTRNGKNMPIRYDTVYGKWICHFTDCKKAANFRKSSK